MTVVGLYIYAANYRRGYSDWSEAARSLKGGMAKVRFSGFIFQLFSKI